MKEKKSNTRAMARARRTLVPDYMFERFDDLTVDFLLGEGIGTLLIDIDNTLAPYEVSEPDERIRGWFDALGAAGIRAALVSNNERERVELFNRTLSLPAYHDCKKPSRKKLLAAMESIGAEVGSTLFLGDQIFTDVASARRLGVRAAIVPPIKDKKTLFFRLKRLLERPIIKKYKRNNKKRVGNTAR